MWLLGVTVSGVPQAFDSDDKGSLLLPVQDREPQSHRFAIPYPFTPSPRFEPAVAKHSLVSLAHVHHVSVVTRQVPLQGPAEPKINTPTTTGICQLGYRGKASLTSDAFWGFFCVIVLFTVAQISGSVTQQCYLQAICVFVSDSTINGVLLAVYDAVCCP